MFRLKIWFNENTPDDELNRLKAMVIHAGKHWKGDLIDESTDKYIVQFTSPSYGIIGVCSSAISGNVELVEKAEKIWWIDVEENTYSDALKTYRKMRAEGFYDKKHT